MLRSADEKHTRACAAGGEERPGHPGVSSDSGSIGMSSERSWRNLMHPATRYEDAGAKLINDLAVRWELVGRGVGA